MYSVAYIGRFNKHNIYEMWMNLQSMFVAAARQVQ